MAAILGLLGKLFGDQYVTEMIMTAIAFASASPGLAEPNLPAPHYTGVASRFGDLDDKWVGGNLKCAPHRRVMPADHICAHRSLSAYRTCGTVLLLENPRTKKRSWCMVMDSGPFGARIYEKDARGKYTKPVKINGKHAWYIKIRKSDKPPAKKCPSGDCVGRWRGYLDISPAAAIELGHNGMEPINAWRVQYLNKQLDYWKKAQQKPRAFLYEGGEPRDTVAALWAQKHQELQSITP